MSVLRFRLRLIFALFACVGIFAACGETGPYAPTGDGSTYKEKPTPTPIPTPTRTPIPPVVAGALTPAPGSIYFGAYANPSGLAGVDTSQSAAQLEQQIGRMLQLDGHYLTFGQDLATKPIYDDFNNYRLPVVGMQCQLTDAQLASGQFDGTINQLAVEVKAIGWPMFIRFFYDPNLGAGIKEPQTCYDPKTDGKGNQFSPDLYIKAWRHFHDVMAADGATNVVWVWSVSGSPLATSPLQYYPGDAYVNWVSMDDFDTTNAGFQNTIANLYGRLTTLGKPIMVTETGESQGQDAFFGTAVIDLKALFPQIKGFMYYDSINYAISAQGDYRITTEAMPAFAKMADDPYMGATYGH